MLKNSNYITTNFIHYSITNSYPYINYTFFSELYSLFSKINNSLISIICLNY